MAAYDLEEQEQIEELKVWWKQYGNMVTTVLLVVSLAVAAWQGWGWWQRDQSAQASTIYVQLQRAASERDAKRTRELAGTLIEKFSSSQYAAMGALISARVQVDAADLPNARAHLQWVVEKAGDPGLRDLARLRLVGVLLDEGTLDEATKLLALEFAPEFKVRHQELKGDLATARGQSADAKAAYEQALTEVEKNQAADDPDASRRASAYREVLLTKIDAAAAGAVVGATEKK